MTLITSISGIRGTIGGRPGEALTPIDTVKFTAAFATLLSQTSSNRKIVIGRDARISGRMISGLVSHTLNAKGFDVVDLGLSTTPTVEMAVVSEQAAGGIIVTASHNPAQWNALKLLNDKGEFISAALGQQLLDIAKNSSFQFEDVTKLGQYRMDDTYLHKHVASILNLPLVNKAAIQGAGFSVIVDAVHSTGGLAVPLLLEALGVRHVHVLYGDPTGHFPHNPEPLPEHLSHISGEMSRSKFDLGIVVDPDVDRLALLCEDGSMFGEEYTLVAVADYVLKHTPGATVSNLSSTRALRDVTESYGCTYYASAVGEVHVVERMKSVEAVIGGEGNGGIIFPELHYGRDALVGIALFLSHLAVSGVSVSKLRAKYPNYYMSKQKIELTSGLDTSAILESIKQHYSQQPVHTEDGVKLEFDTSWVHLRRSNTEPIIRIYAEADTPVRAEMLANKIISDIRELIA